MRSREFIEHIFLFLTLITFFFLLSGCAVPPDEKIVEDSISQYFEARNYRVVEIEIRSIKQIPLSNKVYMGTAGYIVDVRSITMEATADSGAPRKVKKGRRFTFKDAVFQIREKAGERGRWVISVISGVSVI
jgi:hypothetical protein